MARPDVVVTIAKKFAAFDDLWSPKIIMEANGWHMKLVKAKGQFVWHVHDDTDEVFLVVSGRLVVELRDRRAELSAGDVFVVPKGVEHCPDAGEGCEMMLLEPAGVPNTGTVVGELSNADQWI